jgi:hypothetical protein
MELIYIIGGLTLYITGIVTGMYAASQIEGHINNRINGRKKK